MRSVAARTATSWFELTNVVLSGVPFQTTRASVRKFVPLLRSRRASAIIPFPKWGASCVYLILYAAPDGTPTPRESILFSCNWLNFVMLRRMWCGRSHDFDPAREPDGSRRPNGDLLGDGSRPGSSEIPVAEGHHAYQGSHRGQLHHRRDYNLGQRLTI